MQQSEMNIALGPVKTVRVGRHGVIGNDAPLMVIAGPCVIESRDHCMMIAEEMRGICDRLGLQYMFKASYDKANRSAVKSYRGPGIEKGLEILAEVREKMAVDVLTDVHNEAQCGEVADVVDMIQVPAFLCRQTDMLLAAAKAGKPVNVKKGQFMAPWDMKNVIEKLEYGGAKNIVLTERGASFGYNSLVCDPRSLVIMRSLGYPVMFDATHSVQLPGGQGSCSGGQKQFIFPLARAAAAVGIDALFMEVHNDPDKALCDGANSLPLNDVEALLEQVKTIHAFVKR